MTNEILKNSPIGFFDSGVGGLSVYSKFRKLFPNENTIYFGDTIHLPYGNKTKDELIGYAGNILDFFKTKGVKAVVIACNTSSALAYDMVKNNYDFKIFPIIQSCAKVLAEMDIKRMIIFATQATVNSGAYSKEIKKYNPNIDVHEVACPNWVNIVEAGNMTSETAYNDIKNHLTEIAQYNPEKIILGCTHYPYLLDVLSKFYPRDFYIDPADIFVNYIGTHILHNDTVEKGYEEFYVSSEPKIFAHNASLFYNLPTVPTLQKKSQ